jgi:HD-GYP domain-containing protein (c-di-GMP phosphodiesterase class II)
VVDTYVAMTSARPYREAFSAERAIEEIEEKAGTQFDPSVVTIFAEMIRGEANRAPDRASDER